MVSDADTVWLRDPSDYLAQHPSADWFISTDCLSAEVCCGLVLVVVVLVVLFAPWVHLAATAGRVRPSGW